MNNKLAISIPTYNRASILKENLMLMLPEIKKFNVAVYVSDDSSNYETRSIISNLKEEYENIFYSKNEPALGHDKNCLKSLSLPNSEYIWYLGDAQIIRNGAIARVFSIIDTNNYDFLVVSSKNRFPKISSKVYIDFNKFFSELAWHATLTGITIYRKDILFRAHYEKYVNSNFMQLGVILEELVNNQNGLCWINEQLIYHNKNKRGSYWSDNVFKVFAQDWSEFILNLPSGYTEKNKLYVIKSHSINTGIFGVKNLMYLRQKGILSKNSYAKYKEVIRLASPVNRHLVLLISLTPIAIVSGFVKMVKIIFKKKIQDE